MNKLNRITVAMPRNAENSFVVQANPLIEARYKLPLLAQQILRVLISMIQPSCVDIEKRFYQIDVSEFGKLIKRKETSNLKDEIVGAAKNLLKTPIFIKTTDGFIETRWIQAYHYHDNVGYIDFMFSAPLKPFLIELRKRFTQYRLDSVCQLSSQYSIRLYELLRQYCDIGSRIIQMHEIKAMLGIRDMYEDYRGFRRNILLPAHRDITTKTNLKYNWRPIKTGRKVTAIEFYDIVMEKEPEEKLDDLTEGLPHVPAGDIRLLIKTIAEMKDIRPG